MVVYAKTLVFFFRLGGWGCASWLGVGEGTGHYNGSYGALGSVYGGVEGLSLADLS